MRDSEKKYGKIEMFKCILEIFSAVIIGGCGVFLAFRANEIAKYQTQVSMMEMSPYFEISVYVDNEQENGYKIRNIGGYIQDATIILKSIININVKNYGSKNFYFVYDSASKHFTNLKDDEILFSFKGNKFGINNWDYNDDMIMSICEGLETEKIYATINYIEYLEISYLDFDRNIKTEHYLIGVNEGDEYFLSSLPLENEKIEENLFDEVFYNSFSLNSEVSKELGSSLYHGVSRKFDTNAAFVERVLDIVRDYIQDYN